MENNEQKGGVSMFQRMAKEYQNNPKILNDIVGMMSEKIVELETDLKIVTTRADALKNAFDRCEPKATAYDRLMSGGKKTLKEWANIFGSPVAVDKELRGIVFNDIPDLFRTVEAWRTNEYGYIGMIPPSLIDFTGDWKDSLTLPDGWEEK